MEVTDIARLEKILESADRRSVPVRLTFRGGERVTAQIRDLDLHHHHTVTYMDMDLACGARVASLGDITDAVPVGDPSSLYSPSPDDIPDE